MKKVKVWIEETLCREIEIEVPDGLDLNERLSYAEEKAKEMYRDEEIVLDADDFSGLVQMSLEDDETKTNTEWFDI